MITKTKLFILSSIIFIGCSKIKDPFPVEEIKDSFAVGVNNSAVNVVTLDSAITIIGYGLSATFDIDIDQNGNADLTLSSSWTHSNGGFFNYSTGISNINSSYKVSTIEMPVDTFYRCIDTINNITRFYNSFFNWSCSNGVNSITSIATTRVKYPKVYNANYSPNNTESWLNTILKLSEYSGSSLPANPQRYYVYGNWNNEQLKYILIKKDNGSNPLYGWIKLSVTNHYEITLYEYAFQKE